jgi:hypothetical protein
MARKSVREKQKPGKTSLGGNKGCPLQRTGRSKIFITTILQKIRKDLLSAN